MQLGTVGVFSPSLRRASGAARVADAAAELEEMGFGAIFLPGRGPVPMAESATAILGATRHTIVGSGVLSTYATPAPQAGAFFAEIDAAFPGRFLLGLGVSHEALVAPRGQVYGNPIAAMSGYLDQLDALEPAVPVDRRIIAALGPRMLALAAARGRGTVPYLVSAEGTAAIREHLGAGPTVAVMVMCVDEADPTTARAIAREQLAFYMGLPNYTNSIKRLGFGDDDLHPHASDRLIDAIVAWGDESRIAERVGRHLAAGADHVSLNLVPTADDVVPLDRWRRLAGVATSFPSAPQGVL